VVVVVVVVVESSIGPAAGVAGGCGSLGVTEIDKNVANYVIRQTKVSFLSFPPLFLIKM